MTHCLVTGCKTSLYNKAPGVTLHPCPRNYEIRNKWLIILKNKCSMLDFNSSKICSKHFENKYFDSSRKLKENAVPTMFALRTINESPLLKSKLNKLTQAQIANDIKITTMKLREPLNLTEFLTDDLQTKSDAPIEAKLWLLIKKQEHLIARLNESVAAHKSVASKTQTSLDNAKAAYKEIEKSFESQKYIVKALQEKQSSLEEQIEILTAIETR